MAQWFVDASNSTGTEDGLSWQSAFTTIQPAIDLASEASGGEVWVAAGVYDEVRESIIDVNRSGGSEFFANTGSVLVRSNVALLGGFLGGEANATDRDPDSNATTISGAVALDGSPASHVVVMQSNSTIDGFVVTGGSAAGSPNNIAGGVYAPDPGFVLRNLRIHGNSGVQSPSVVFGNGGTIESCEIYDNAPDFVTSALSVIDSNVSDCVFRDNPVAAARFRGSSRVSRCMFLRNTAVRLGGAASLVDQATIDSSVFMNNEGDEAGALFISTEQGSPAVSITNSFFHYCPKQFQEN